MVDKSDHQYRYVEVEKKIPNSTCFDLPSPSQITSCWVHVACAGCSLGPHLWPPLQHSCTSLCVAGAGRGGAEGGGGAPRPRLLQPRHPGQGRVDRQLRPPHGGPAQPVAVQVRGAVLGTRQRGEAVLEAWNNGKEVPRWGVAEIQKMSPSTTERCYCCH